MIAPLHAGRRGAVASAMRTCKLTRRRHTPRDMPQCHYGGMQRAGDRKRQGRARSSHSGVTPTCMLISGAATRVCCSGDNSFTIATQYPTLIKARRMFICRASVMAAHPVLSGHHGHFVFPPQLERRAQLLRTRRK